MKIVTNGKWLWMAGNDATLQRWDLEQPGNAPEMVTPISGFVSAMELSPQGNWLAITDQKTARVWDLRHSAQEPVLDLAADISFGINNHDELLFSTDERRLIVNHGTKIQILNLQNLADEPITLGGVVREMGGMTLSPDGHWLAGKDVLSSELRLWNLQDLASEPMVLQEQSDVFDFSPDGKWLAMSELSKIGLLRLDRQELLALACEAVGSNLSRRQWTEHFPSQREYVPTCPQWPEGKDKIVVITTG
jgi:WD40 repeat protein